MLAYISQMRGWEWLILLLIVVIIFGVGRIGKLGGELGKGARSIKEAFKPPQDNDKAEK